MLVVSNVVKKGIEVPEVGITIAPDETSVTFGAIDKVKYADWLNQNISAFTMLKTDEVPSIGGTYVYETYLGDEITISMEGSLVTGMMGLCYNYFEL